MKLHKDINALLIAYDDYLSHVKELGLNKKEVNAKNFLTFNCLESDAPAKRTPLTESEVQSLRNKAKLFRDSGGEYLQVVELKLEVCECKKHSIKTPYGFEICTNCGNEFDE